MFHEVRGTHSCYVCNRAMNWVADLQGGSMVVYGSDVVAGVTAVGGRNPSNQLPLTVKLVCPECGSNNAFSYQHTLQ